MTAFACAVVEAQTLPATAPTTPLAQAAPQKAIGAADQPAQRADVKYSTGLLTVSADNSSLNQILRDVGRATGMKITGGVNDERVYGSYGPADTSTVLSALLKGTGSNMMLVLDLDQSPRELVLTPRGGGPTPPSPNAGRGRDRDEDDLPPQRREHFARPDGARVQPQPGPPQPQFNPPQPPQPTSPSQLQIAPQAPPTAVNPTATDTTQQSPNGVKTPQEIYDQLMKLQQQKATTPTTPPQ
jgi:hypothetical protein